MCTPNAFSMEKLIAMTGNPTSELGRVRDAVLGRPVPLLAAPFVQTELFDEYCVYESRLPMPVYQAGDPPFDDSGGGWAFDDDGEPVLQAEEMARIVVTVPRVAMPADGYPTVLFSRTGGGGDRPPARAVGAPHLAPRRADLAGQPRPDLSAVPGGLSAG